MTCKRCVLVPFRLSIVVVLHMTEIQRYFQVDVSEFDIPVVSRLPTLESILNDDELDFGGSFFDSASYSAASYTSGVDESSIASFDVVSGASSIKKCADSLRQNDSLIKLAKLRKVSADSAKLVSAIPTRSKKTFVRSELIGIAENSPFSPRTDSDPHNNVGESTAMPSLQS